MIRRTTALVLLSLGCSSDPAPPPQDASTAADIGSDSQTVTDVGNDASTDAPTDTPAAADAGSDAPTADAGLTLAVIEARVFRPHCAIPSCHASSEPTGRMRLDENNPATTLRDVAAMGVSCSGQGLVRVRPGDPMGSLLYRKIAEDSPPCGSRMPQGAPPLSPELIALVRQWIAAGAP